MSTTNNAAEHSFMANLRENVEIRKIVRYEFGRFVDSLPDPIYVKQYLSNKNPASSLIHGKIIFFNKPYLKGIIDRVIDGDPRMKELGVEKIIREENVIDQNNNVDLSPEKINAVRCRLRFLTDVDLHPENAKQFEKDDHEVIGTNKQLWDIVEHYNFHNKTPHSIATSKVPWLDNTGTVVRGIIGISRNISGRVDWMNLMSSQFPGICFVVKNNKFVYINKTGADMLGFDTPQELHAKLFASVLKNEKEYDSMLEILFNSPTGDLPNHPLTLKNAKTGEATHALATVSKRKNEEGKMAGFHGVIIEENPQFRELKRLNDLKKRISSLSKTVDDELRQIFDDYTSGKPLSNTKDIDQFSPDVKAVFYWIAVHKFTIPEIIRRVFLKKIKRKVLPPDYKKTPDYKEADAKVRYAIQHIRDKLEIKGSGTKGIIAYAKEHHHI